MARTKSPTSDSTATIGFEATALRASATRRCKATLRSLLRSREANKAKDNRSNNMDDGRNSTPRPPLRAEARRAGGVEEVAAAPSPHRRTVK